MASSALYTVVSDLFRSRLATSSTSSCPLKCIAGGLAILGAGAAIGYFVASRSTKCCRVNNKIKLGQEKIADVVDVEDIGEKKVYCRCWKSEKFPYCDGAHSKHNKETGDNVGPLIVKGKEEQK